MYFDGPFGESIRYEDVPLEYRAQRDDLHGELVEHLVNCDDVLGDIFLEDREPNDEEIQAAIRRATIARKFTPVLVGSALKNKGVQPLLDAAVDYMPNPTQVTNYAIDADKVTKDEDGEDVPVKLRMNPERSDKHPFVGLAFKLEQGKYDTQEYTEARFASFLSGGFTNMTSTVINPPERELEKRTSVAMGPKLKYLLGQPWWRRSLRRDNKKESDDKSASSLAFESGRSCLCELHFGVA